MDVAAKVREELSEEIKEQIGASIAHHLKVYFDADPDDFEKMQAHRMRMQVLSTLATEEMQNTLRMLGSMHKSVMWIASAIVGMAVTVIAGGIVQMIWGKH